MIVIDFEVFKHDWCVCGLDLVNQKKIEIVNDPRALRDFYEANKNNVFIGYNIRNYDQYIFKSILCGFNPKQVNDWIIKEKQAGYKFSSMFNRIVLPIFDIMPSNQLVGLKQLEGFMGVDIRETTVPFDIDRKLTKAEMDEVLYYCNHDCECTAMVLNKRIEEYTSQLELVKMFDMPRTAMGKTKAQLSAEILGAVRTPNRGDELNYNIPDNLKIVKYQYVVDWFRNAVNDTDKMLKEVGLDLDPTNSEFLKTFYGRSLKTVVAGTPHIFAWGGLHGAIENYHKKGRFINVDVASYYPSMMIEYGYESRNIQDPEKYSEIYHTRLKYKAMKDKRANPLKIVLNSTYGAMKDRFNPLYDPRQANSVCVTGQLLLLDLLEHLEYSRTCNIVQSNTDGILVELTGDYEQFRAVCDEWQQRSGMNLEFDEYVEVWQKDVNNYVIIAADGSYKSKGAYVKKLNDLEYDLPIVNKALVNYMVHGVNIAKTIYECSDLREFQKIVKISNKYLYGVHNGEMLQDTTFRVFASNDESDTTIFKVKDKNGREVPEKFANTPDHCFIYNDDVLSVGCLPEKLDKSWYVDLAYKRLGDFVDE